MFLLRSVTNKSGKRCCQLGKRMWGLQYSAWHRLQWLVVLMVYLPLSSQRRCAPYRRRVLRAEGQNHADVQNGFDCSELSHARTTDDVCSVTGVAYLEGGFWHEVNHGTEPKH